MLVSLFFPTGLPLLPWPKSTQCYTFKSSGDMTPVRISDENFACSVVHERTRNMNIKNGGISVPVNVNIVFEIPDVSSSPKNVLVC